MTKKRMLLLVFGAVLIALITLITALRTNKETAPSPFPVNIGTLENGDTRITLRTAEELAAFLAKGSSSYEFSKLFSQEDVPALIALLEDPKYIRLWSRTMVIAAASDEQHMLQLHLMHYLRTDYSGFLNERDENISNKDARCTAVIMLGLVADEQGIELLETIALSNDGLYSVTADWLHEPTSNSDDRDFEYIGSLRGRAALGLVHSQNQPSIALIEELHRETVDALKMAARAHNLENLDGYKWKDVFDGEEKLLKSLFSSLIDALASRDTIEEIGLVEYRKSRSDAQKAMYLHARYAHKYRIKFE